MFLLRLILRLILRPAFVLLLLLFVVPVVFAQAADNPLADVLAWLAGAGNALKPYAGWAAFTLFAVDIAKRVGWVKDGDAGKASAIVNLAGALGLYALTRFAPDVPPAEVDTVLGEVAQLGVALIGLVGQIGATRLFYWITKTAGATFSFGSRPVPPALR